MLEALLLSAWIGGAVLFATVVAPAAFAVLPSRSVAGVMVGRVLPVVFLSGLAIAIVAAALNLWRGRARGRVIAVGAMAAACAVAQFVIAPRIASLRASIGGALDALPAGDARRAQFGQLHAISVGWLGLAMVAALVAVVLAVRTPEPRP